jgi:hypothetical protein
MTDLTFHTEPAEVFALLATAAIDRMDQHWAMSGTSRSNAPDMTFSLCLTDPDGEMGPITLGGLTLYGIEMDTDPRWIGSWRASFSLTKGMGGVDVTGNKDGTITGTLDLKGAAGLQDLEVAVALESR